MQISCRAPPRSRWQLLRCRRLCTASR
jgi:hypothetical protein